MLSDGTAVALTRERLAAPLEGALSALWLSLVLLAAGLVAVRTLGPAHSCANRMNIAPGALPRIQETCSET